MNKIQRKDGVEYFLCEHLEKETQQIEQWVVYLGETRRLIVCPVCHNQMIGSLINHIHFAVEHWNKETVERN